MSFPVSVLREKNDDVAFEIVKKFIESYPTKLNEEFVKGVGFGTILHFSCYFNLPRVVSYLLSKNADVTKCFSVLYNLEGGLGFWVALQGLTAKQIAEKKGYRNIVTLFEQYERAVVVDNQQSTINNQQIEQYERAVGKYFSSKAVDHIKQHLSNIMQKKTPKARTACLFLLEEKFEDEKLDNDLKLFKNLESIFIEQIKDPFDFGLYSSTWNNYFPMDSTPTQTPPIPTLKPTTPTPIPTITPQFRLEQRREPLTARLQPGRRFLSIVPNAPTDQESIISSLKDYANSCKPSLDIVVIQQFEDKIEDFTYDDHTTESSLSYALCWLYTADSWVYQHTNSILREDSSVMSMLSPFMNGLMKSYKFMNSCFYYSGVVYRRTRMSPTGIQFYRIGAQFVWSAFTSTTIEFSEDNTFGDVLFVIRIPEQFNQYALMLETFSMFPVEREVLLLPNLGFSVISITNGPSTYHNASVVIEVQVNYVCNT